MRLVMHSTDGSSTAIDLNDAQLPLVIGRDADLAKVAIVDGQISRVHCRLLKVGEDWVVEDLTSRNGTFVNGARVAKSVIRPGDRLRVGSSQFTLEDEACGPDPLIGARISGFAIEEPLGRGRYGAVYKGTQVALHRPVAIKVLAPEFASDPERVQAFLTEARRAGALNHPNLVQVHDVISSGTWYFLVMELMVGSVGDLLRDNGPLEEEAVRRILADTCAALAFAEANRLVHRDVKPDNIMLGAHGDVALVDWGECRLLSEADTSQAGSTVGTPAYMSPEQARGEAADQRSDVYALGATLY
ncbi:MAG TPA: hypothetical protein DCS97_00665, partial [Planctomycetes bacterium]|nr:hypothetical protein [Planctomycetota bacterium]